jgi:hypothetical protein
MLILLIIANLEATGFVSNVIARNFSLDRVSLPIHVYQTNGGHSYVSLPQSITVA